MNADQAGGSQTFPEQVKSLPTGPGAYIFRDERGDVLYVGKANSLRTRVRSYLRKDRQKSPKVHRLVDRIHSVESLSAQSEAEALFLEWNLIKEYSPPFNIQLRDDKSYPYIRITVSEAFPRIFVTRRLVDDGSRYFGPFTDVGAMRRALRTIKRMYFVRSCRYDMPRDMPERPCLDYHIGRCKAPCADLQTQAEYRAMIDEILAILSGRTAAVRRAVQGRMKDAAAELDFERAAELRDVLKGLDSIERRQTAIDFRGGDHDVLGIATEGDLACGAVLRVREGRVLGTRIHYLRNIVGETPSEIVGAFVKGFYLRQEEIPAELYVPEPFSDLELVSEYLSARRDGAFAIKCPQRGAGRQLLHLAERNARHVLQTDLLADPEAILPANRSEGDAAVRLAEALGLAAPPANIVCFDVSTLGGTDSVGSAVWLAHGRPDKNEYRRFRIRSVEVGRTDDYAMMQEIVRRYFSRRVREGNRLPDLVVIDGGRGQLSAALQAMEATDVSDLPVIALAKREEEVYRPGEPTPLRLLRTDPGLLSLQRARDEAHRFAITYNRTLRKRRTLRSRLSDIPGVGPAREQELLRRFGSLERVREATVDALASLPGIGPMTAKRIHDALLEDDALPEDGERGPADRQPA
jgi:excinuclease ABC subunit C